MSKKIEFNFGGFGIGSVLATIISWTTYHSIPWAIVHDIFSWFFIVWWVLTNY